MEASHIIPDDIRNIDNMTPQEQIRALHDYIQYMREQIDFWASRRTMDIDKVTRNINIILQNRSITGFRNGDILETTLFGYGCSTGTTGTYYFQLVLPYPVRSDAAYIESGRNIDVRGVQGHVLTTNSITDLGIIRCTPNQTGILLYCEGLTTNFAAQTPVSIAGNFRIKFLEGD